MYAGPAYTSQQCSPCGHTGRHSHRSQAPFACRSCGTVLHADTSRSSARKGETAWAAGREPGAPATP
ncbi:zinc ribbon domain-containing protein [Streptomyces sp. NPDC001774]